MLFIIYPFISVILLVLFILFTAIGLTIKFKIISLKETKELRSIFAVKWLFFSHTFLIEEPLTKNKTFEEPKKSEVEKVVETLQDEKIGIKKKTENGVKTRSIDGIRGEEKVKKENVTESKKGMTTREMFKWSFEAFSSLRKPLFCLFSDLLNGIKIKSLESCMTFCLPDPSDTGILCGFLHAIAGFVYSRCRHCNFSIKPEFMDPMLNLQGNLEIRIKIHSLILPFIKFIFNWNTLSFTYSVVKDILQRKWKSTWKPKWKLA